MNDELKTAARQMGYRPMPRKTESEVSATVWGKPVGYSLMVISDTEEHGIEWLQWFWHRQDDKPILWNRKVWPIGGDLHERSDVKPVTSHFMFWLKECENWEQKASYCGEAQGAFEFLTPSQSVVL